MLTKNLKCSKFLKTKKTQLFTFGSKAIEEAGGGRGEVFLKTITVAP